MSASAHVDCEQEIEVTEGHSDLFNYYPHDCYWEHFLDQDQEVFSQIFERDCKGKASCQFTFRQNQLPVTSCFLPHASPSNWQYGMVAYCASSSIRFGSNEVKVSKNTVGFVVVIFDLLITYGFWFAMLAFVKL